MLTVKFVIISTIIYVISMIFVIVIISPNLINYAITAISLLYLISIILKALEIRPREYIEDVSIKEPRSKLEYLQSLVNQIDKRNSNAALMLLTEEIRIVGTEIIAMYLKINTVEVKSMSSEELSKIVHPITLKVIKGEVQIRNRQELVMIISDLKNILQMI